MGKEPRSMTDRDVADSALGEPAAPSVSLARGLSTKLLLLTVCFVLLAEVLIFLPSIANFRLRWLEQRLGTAAAVSIVLIESSAGSLSRAAQDEVLKSLGANAIAVRDEGRLAPAGRVGNAARRRRAHRRHRHRSHGCHGRSDRNAAFRRAAHAARLRPSRRQRQGVRADHPRQRLARGDAGLFPQRGAASRSSSR